MDDADADADVYDEAFEAASDKSSRRDDPPEPPRSPDSVAAPPAPREAAPARDASSIVRPPPSITKPVRTALDQAPWTFAVRASRVRALRVPIAPSVSSGVAASGGFPVIRDLRVFATVDKQPMQSRGSRWKQEPRAAEAMRPLVVAAARANSSPGRRRSGVHHEATWRNDDGVLAWILTMDRFRRIKAYSPRIKLFVVGIGANARADSVRVLSEDSPTNHRESIVSLGWFFLDLRTPDLPARWFKLQNSPFGGEIFVSTTFAPTEAVPRDRHAHAAPSLVTRTRSLDLFPAVATKRREHSQSADAEYFRLGDGRGADVFLFTVFLRGATQLQQVLESSVETKAQAHRAKQSGMWLSYSLFDVVVQTDVFYNFQRAEFAPIRDSFRVLSTTHDVLAFLKAQRFLSIYLCTHDRVLANADVAFDPLIEQGLTASGGDGEEVTTIDGTFPFGTSEGGVSASFSIERTPESIVEENKLKMPGQQVSQGVSDENTPDNRQFPATITVNHIQMRSDTLKMYAEKEAVELEVLCGEQAVRCPIRFNAFTADYALGDCPELVLELDHVEERLPSLVVTCFSSSTDHAIAASSVEEAPLATHDGKEAQLALYQSGRRVGECIVHCKPASAEQEVTTKPPSEPRSIPGVSHTYRVMIRLKALRDFETSRPVVISYTNPFTGHERVETPLISVMRKAETEISEAYCLFELHRDEPSMREAMETPVVMDVALALPDGSRQSIGSLIFSLNFLYFSEETFCCSDPSCDATFTTHPEATTHWTDVHSESSRDRLEAESTVHSLKRCWIYLPVTDAQKGDTSRRVGAVQVEAYFEDAGPMSDSQVRLAEEMRVSRSVQSQQRCFTLETTPPKLILNRASGVEMPARREQRKSAILDNTAAPTILDNPQPIDTTKELEEIKAQLLQERSVWLQEQKTQQAQWKKRIAEMEKARMDELEEEWARREEERSAVLKAAQAEYQRLEHKLRVTLGEVEARERKLSLAESALERDQRMLKEDTDLLRKRLQSEQSHALSLAQKQIDALEKRIVDLQTNLDSAEKRALQVEEDFTEYRKQQRKVPESKLREEIASLKGQVAELEKTKQIEIRAREHAEANVDKMKSQLEKMAKLVQAEKKKNESRVMDDLEKLRLKYIAREERFVLDGDREELRAIKKQLDDLRRVNLHVDGSTPTAVKSHIPYRNLRVTTRHPEDSPHSRNSVAPSYRHDELHHSWSSIDPSSPVVKLERRRLDKLSDTSAKYGDRELRRLEMSCLLVGSTTRRVISCESLSDVLCFVKTSLLTTTLLSFCD